jgi:hypothetical protein
MSTPSPRQATGDPSPRGLPVTTLDPPAPLDDLLSELRYRRWTLHLWGPKDAPDLMAATFRWTPRQEVDVIILRSHDSATAFRTLYFDHDGMFRPEIVHWQYHADNPWWVFRAVFTLPHPGKPDAPEHPQTPHKDCHIPDGLPSPQTIRPLGVR